LTFSMVSFTHRNMEPRFAPNPSVYGGADGKESKNSVSLVGDGQEELERASGLAPLGPMIARTVSLSVVVKDFGFSRTVLDAILARHHGYAASLSASTPEHTARSLEVSLRIPAAELNAAVAELKSLGQVQNETQNGEEVTQQHADLVARLKNSRETEQRLQSILLERTGKVSERAFRSRRGSPLTRLTSTRPHRQFPLASTTPSFGILLILAANGPSLLIWLALLLPGAWLLRRRWLRASDAASSLIA
jgi:Domain of unknown function (DUF4349)